MNIEKKEIKIELHPKLVFMQQLSDIYFDNMMIFIKNPRRDSSRDFHLQRSNRRPGMSLIPRRAGLASMVVAALTALTAGAVQAQSAQDYPSKPIRIIAPFPAGSGPDVNTREIAGELGKVLGQSVLVENRPGASNMIGMEAGAKAAADGAYSFAADRAIQFGTELGWNLQVVASGQEWRRPDLLRNRNTAFIVPVAFPTLPKLPEPSDWDAISLDLLRQWDWAPENPAVLRRTGVDIALTTHGLPDRKDFRKNLRAALDGLASAGESSSAAPAQMHHDHGGH